jgi:DNA end-binding protein Ku
MFFADEVRSFGEIDKGAGAKIRDGEMDLAQQLIDGLSNDEFKPENYEDRYRLRVLQLIDSKVEGKEITPAAPEPQRAQVIDLMDALKESLAKRVPADKKPPAKAPRRAEPAADAAPSRPTKRASAGKK